MRQLSLSGAADINIRLLALNLTQHLAQKDYRGEACALNRYVRDYIRYVRDIRNIETLHDCSRILQLRSGDCDDKSILLAALLTSIGHTCRFIAIAFKPESYSHVWVQDLVNGNWLDLDPTEPLECGGSIPQAGAWGFLTRMV